MSLEALLIQAYVKLKASPIEENGSKWVPLVRYGAYEVRLLEPAPNSTSERFVFWLELFDYGRQISINGGGAIDLEEAVALAEQLVAQAKESSKG